MRSYKKGFMRLRLPRKNRFILLSVLTAVAVQMSTMKAYAGFEASDALITVGISTGAGAIFGLSTVSFYNEPSKHMGNILIGAGLGLIVGVGIAAYMVASGNQEEEIDPEELLIDTKKKEMKEDAGKANEKKEQLKKQLDKDKDSRIWKNSRRQMLASNTRSYLGPSVALKILELRF